MKNAKYLLLAIMISFAIPATSFAHSNNYATLSSTHSHYGHDRNHDDEDADDNDDEDDEDDEDSNKCDRDDEDCDWDDQECHEDGHCGSGSIWGISTRYRNCSWRLYNGAYNYYDPYGATCNPNSYYGGNGYDSLYTGSLYNDGLYNNAYYDNAYGATDSLGQDYCYNCEGSYDWSTNPNTDGSSVFYGTDQYGSGGSSTTVNIYEGALIKSINSPDVYIVKYAGGKQFKRLIVSPSVFTSYKHLSWENVMVVSQRVLDSFKTSNLVRAVGDDRIFQLIPKGDTGMKRLVPDERSFLKYNFDWDAIYEINAFDRDTYMWGDDLI